MALKEISNQITKVFFAKNFLFYSSLIIFLLSIFLRSMIDIGSDTGVYIEIGRKISDGGKYYYNFFESNFPLSFYFYALQHQISKFTNLNPIILSEIIINFLAILSIFWSKNILKRSSFSANRAHLNIIIISFLLGFFLRPLGLFTGEFGTKTSLLLILFYPYFSYSFYSKNSFKRSDLIYRGILMGLIPCLKPHYLIFIVVIESYKFYQSKKFSFFIELDKLLMLFIGMSYLLIMFIFTPEFFEFIVPMWPKIYPAYDDYKIFIENSWIVLSTRILPTSFVFLALTRLKFEENNKILFLFYLAASLLLIIENISTIDQCVIFYAISTICYTKIIYDLCLSEKIKFSQNKFLISCLFFIPAFDFSVLPSSIFGAGGFLNAWWLLILAWPFIAAKKMTALERKSFFTINKIVIFLLLYTSIAFLTYLIISYCRTWHLISFNLTILLVGLVIFERKIYKKFSDSFSAFGTFVILAAASCLFYLYISSIFSIFKRDSDFTFPNKISDMVQYYSRIYAPNKDNGFVMMTNLIGHQFPALNYLEKKNYQLGNVSGIGYDGDEAGYNFMFKTSDTYRLYTKNYLFDNLKSLIKNPKIKLIFVNNSAAITGLCQVGYLEYNFLDKEFKKDFLTNFRFKNRVLISKEVDVFDKNNFLNKEKDDIFNQIKPSKERIIYDFEIYVRK